MSAQPVPLEDIDDLYGLCAAALRRGPFIPPNQLEDEVQEAVAYVCRMHTLWDPSRTTGTFLDHAWYQLTHYYVNGDAVRRRMRQARHDNAYSGGLDTDRIEADRAVDDFKAVDERIDAERYVSQVLPGMQLTPLHLKVMRLLAEEPWLTDVDLADRIDIGRKVIARLLRDMRAS